MQFNFLGRQVSFFVKERPSLFTNGITNVTQDRRFVLFADYDNTNLQVVEEDAEFIQQNYDVGDLIILNSSEEMLNSSGDVYGNYHLIGFTKIEFPKLKEILSNLRCDKHFKQGWKYQQRVWVLRLGYKTDIKTKQKVKGKPRFISHIPQTFECEKVYSSAHLTFFNKLYNLRIKKKDIDGSNKIKLIDYVTR